MMNNNKSIFRPEKWADPVELCEATMDYYEIRNREMQRDKCLNFDTFVRIVKGQAVPVAIDDAWGMEV